jgi:competence protein ComEC
MRNFWNQIPGLRIVFSVMAGIGIEIYADTQLHISREALWLMLVLFAASLLIGIILHLIKNVSTLYRLRIVNGIALSIFLISFGYILTWLNAEKNFKNHFQNFLAKENFMVVTIVKPPLEKEKIVTVVAEVKEVKSQTTTTATRGNILVSVLRDSTSENLKYGDVIIFNSNIEEFEEPKNPDEFSFKLYQSFHNIYHRTFLKPGDWKLMSVNEGNIFFATIYEMREYFLSLITKYVKDKNDFAVASAIMLGYNDYMNGDITRA